jgi:hypothetical protein
MQQTLLEANFEKTQANFHAVIMRAEHIKFTGAKFGVQHHDFRNARFSGIKNFENMIFRSGEVDFAHKAYEGIGQSLYYSILTKKKPGLILIIENRRLDLKYILRAKTVCRKHKIVLWTIDKNKCMEKIYDY